MRKHKGGEVGVKRPRLPVANEYDNPLNHLTHFLGDENILYDFAVFHGRTDLKVKNKQGRLALVIEPDFSGIAFNDGHWKGYDGKDVVYDSYLKGIQIKGTNNYCQSYAAYLWAKRGNMEPFKAREYVENTKKMSQLWLDYFDSIMNSGDDGLKTWLLNSIQQGSKASEKERTGTYTYEELYTTLTKLVNDLGYRTEFSNSI